MTRERFALCEFGSSNLGKLIVASILACAGCNHGPSTGGPRDGSLGLRDLGGQGFAPAADLAAADLAPGCAVGPGQDIDRWIAFDSLRVGNRDLYAVRADGCDLRRLTLDPSVDQQPAWSPDGKSLAFASDREGTMQIWTMPLGGAATRVTQHANGADQPSWSPDGKSIVFHADVGVWWIGANGTGEHQVIAGLDRFNQYAHPTFVATGANLVVDEGNLIQEIGLDGSNPRFIFLDTTTTVEHPSISPDGSLIACSIVCDPMQESLWVSDFHSTVDPCRGGTRVTALTDPSSRMPAFGPNGLIAFERGPAATAIALGGVAIPAVDLTSGGDDRNPAWSPEGASIP